MKLNEDDLRQELRRAMAGIANEVGHARYRAIIDSLSDDEPESEIWNDDVLALETTGIDEILTRLDTDAKLEMARWIDHLIEMGAADDQLRVEWRHHLLRVLGPGSRCGSDIEWTTPPRGVYQQVLSALNVRLVDNLGPKVAAIGMASLTGAEVVVSRAAVRDPQEVEFLAQHTFLHLVVGDVSPELGYWIEFTAESQADHALRPWMDAERLALALDHEAELNDATTAMVYPDVYGGGWEVGQGESLVRITVARQLDVLPPPLRSIGRALADRIKSFWPRPSLQFTADLAVVRAGEWAPVYVVWSDPSGHRWRRRVPSRRVLRELRLRLRDVIGVKQEVVDDYQYAGLLIDPVDVEVVRAALVEVTKCISVSPVRTVGRCLSGRESRSSPLAAPQSDRAQTGRIRILT